MGVHWDEGGREVKWRIPSKAESANHQTKKKKRKDRKQEERITGGCRWGVAPDGRQEGLSMGVHWVEGCRELRWEDFSKGQKRQSPDQTKKKKKKKKKERKTEQDRRVEGCRGGVGLQTGDRRDCQWESTGLGRSYSEMEDFSKGRKVPITTKKKKKKKKKKERWHIPKKKPNHANPKVR